MRSGLTPFIGSLFLVILGFALGAYCSSFDAYVDKPEIAPGETVKLTLEYQGQSNEEPDLSLLQQKFTIVSRQTSTSSTFMNGNFSAKTVWTFEIFPKTTDAIVTIPRIKLGSAETLPIRITQSTKALAKEPVDGLSLEVFVDKNEVYIHAQVVFRIKITTSLPLRNGSLTKPEISDAIIEPLDEDSQREVIENGKKFHIFERSFAIFPSKSGTLTIPPIIFRGVVISDSGPTNFPSFFGHSRQVAAHSNEIVLKVKDIPQGYPKDHVFLPVENLTIEDSFDPSIPFEVNKIVTRKFMLKAYGSLSSFLPTISTPNVKHVQIYYEAGNKVDRKLDDAIEASSQFSHVYMPTAPGEILIPEQIIYWWNTKTDELQTTVIKAIEGMVTGDASPALPTDDEVKVAKESAKTESVSIHKYVIVAIVFIVFALLMMLLLVLLIRINRLKNEPAFRYEFNQRIKKIIHDCNKGQARMVYQDLSAFRLWLNKNDHISLFNDQLTILLKKLEQRLFEPQKIEDYSALLNDIKKVLKNSKAKKDKAGIFPPLYPN